MFLTTHHQFLHILLRISIPVEHWVHGHIIPFCCLLNPSFVAVQTSSYLLAFSCSFLRLFVDLITITLTWTQIRASRTLCQCAAHSKKKPGMLLYIFQCLASDTLPSIETILIRSVFCADNLRISPRCSLVGQGSSYTGRIIFATCFWLCWSTGLSTNPTQWDSYGWYCVCMWSSLKLHLSWWAGCN